MTQQRQPVIRASEIGQYLYCSRSWWLNRVCGCTPSNTRQLADGRVRHMAHGRTAFASVALRKLGYILVGLAFLATLMLLWVTVRGG